MNANDQAVLIKQVVEELLNKMNGSGSVAPRPAGGQVSAADYPLGEKVPDQIQTPTGKKLSDLNLQDMISGKLSGDDMRISPETLEMQAQVAESVGRDAFATNLRRAAELIPVPDDRLLEIYNALRPYRSTKQELLDIANELETKYNGKINAALVREAAELYDKRGRLKA